MKGFKSIILHQSLQVNYNGNIDGFTFLQQVGDYCRNSVTAAIESYLAKFDDTDEVIQVQKIEIEIEAAGDNWEESVKNEIQKKLSLIFDDSSKFPGKGITVQKIPDVFFTTLVFYLKNGFLPWNAEVSKLSDYQEKTTDWLRSADDAHIKKLKEGLNSRNAIIRLSALLEKEGFTIYLKKSFSHSGAELRVKTDTIFRISGTVSNTGDVTSTALINAARRIAAICKPYIIRASLRNDTGAEAWNNFIKEMRNADHSLYELFFTEFLFPEGVEITGTAGETNSRDEQLGKTNHDEKTIVIKENPVDSKINPPNNQTVYVKNAGAAIIAAFIPALLTNTGILKNKKIADASKAVMLLHYCVTGNKCAADFELPLLKVLCNLPLDVAVETYFTEDDELLKHADEMLASVTEHWNILGDTSVESLRRSFLQRNGKLYFSNKRWHLFAEHESYDVLLQQLPWNINLVRLPWMDHSLETEWVF